MVSVRELLHAAAARGDVEARHEAEILLGHVLQRERAWLFTHADFVPDQAQVDRYNELMKERQRGEPIAYLVGHRGFWTLDLLVTPDVLVPRAETELLVELALARIPLGVEFRIADLGTGSGAIALAIAGDRPHWRGVASDASRAWPASDGTSRPSPCAIGTKSGSRSSAVQAHRLGGATTCTQRQSKRPVSLCASVTVASPHGSRPARTRIWKPLHPPSTAHPRTTN